MDLRKLLDQIENQIILFFYLEPVVVGAAARAAARFVVPEGHVADGGQR